MNETAATDRAEADTLAHLGADRSRAIILTPDPVQFSVTTGFTAAALPNNGIGAILAAAHDLHATHIIFSSEDLPVAADQLPGRFHAVASAAVPIAHTIILQLSASPNGP